MPEISNNRNMRLAYSFRRAARATFITSSTTSGAFLANAFNPIMPMASFGIYASILIIVNYMLIVLMFPPIIIWWEDNLTDKYCPCQRVKNEKPITTN